MSDKPAEPAKPTKPHRLQETHFATPTWCTVCKKFIWGITGKQGFECTVCPYKVHHRCKEAAEATNCVVGVSNTGISADWEGPLTLKEITGKEHTLNVHSSMTIGNLKEWISGEIGCKPEKIILLKYAQHIEKDDSKTLREVNVAKGMVIQVLED